MSINRNTMFFAPALLSIFLTMAAFGSFAQAQANNNCRETDKGTNICEIQVDVGGERTPYFYEIRRSLDNAPTVIAIPGGPGQGLIGSLNMVTQSDHIPKNYGVILVDPRGFGKNNYGTDPQAKFYSSELIAKDLLSVIKTENLVNYFIHGQSYGTITATILGHFLEASDLPLPQAIVLSGVANEAFLDPLKGYNEQLGRIFYGYSDSDRKKIRQNLAWLISKFGVNSRVFALLWISALTANSEDLFSDGINSINMKKFIQVLNQGDWESKNQVLQFFLETSKSLPVDLLPLKKDVRSDMPERVKCTELTKNDGMWDITFDTEKFELVSFVNDCELKGYKLLHPYLSRDYQIKTIPLIYIQGRLDPATPWKKAREHFENQTNKEKTFILLENEAHTGLSGLWRCKDNLWKNMATGSSGFASYVNGCSGSTLRILGIGLPNAD